MRYSDRVKFLLEEKGEYNPKMSKTEMKVTEIPDVYPCNLNPLSPRRVLLEFGAIERDISVIRLQGEFVPKVNRAVIRGRKYVILQRVYHTHETVFFIEQIK